MLIFIMMLFFICWSPLLVFNVLGAFDVYDIQLQGVAKHIKTVFSLMSYVNRWGAKLDIGLGIKFDSILYFNSQLNSIQTYFELFSLPVLTRIKCFSPNLTRMHWRMALSINRTFRLLQFQLHEPCHLRLHVEKLSRELHLEPLELLLQNEEAGTVPHGPDLSSHEVPEDLQRTSRSRIEGSNS